MKAGTTAESGAPQVSTTQRRRTHSRLAPTIVACALAAGAAAALERDEFVAGWPIELPGPEGVFDVPLTLEVYRAAQDIGQVAILDERGEPMPFYRVDAPSTAVEERVTLGASPLYAGPAGGAANVSVESGADRTNVTPTRPAGPDARAEAVYFDAGGRLPVAAVALDFGATNGWARASVAAAGSPQGPWRTVVAGRLFYETAFEGRALASPRVNVGRVEARHWRVVFEDGVPSPPPQLELLYPREHLRFAADGTPPFVLAAGTSADAAGPDPTFAAVWRELQAAGASAAAAMLGARVELGGPEALDEPFELPWRRAGLWAVLGVGMITVAWMALRLARELFRER